MDHLMELKPIIITELNNLILNDSKNFMEDIQFN